MLLTLLSAPIAEGFWPEFGEKLSLIAALGFFLYYFMKELKEVRIQMEKTRREYEAKLDHMFERLVELEKGSQATMTRLTNSIEDLADKMK